MEVDKGVALSVEYLLQNYPNIVDCRSSYKGTNCTALSVACQKGHLEMAKLLMQYKASVNLKDIKDKDDEDEDDEDEDDEDEDDHDDDDDENCNGPIHHAVLG
jgi:ankyrin repeat protein